MADKILRYAEFNQEGVAGTDYGTKKTQGLGIHEDIRSATLDSPDDPILRYEGGLGRVTRIIRPGYYAPEGNIVFAPRMTTLGQYFFWALGAGVKTGNIYGAEGIILPSFNARVGKDLFEQVFLGCVINTLALEASDEFAQLTLDIVAQKDEKADLQEISDLGLGEISPLAFHEISVSAGMDNHKIRSMTLNINNNIDADSGRGAGSRFPYIQRAGERNTTLEFELYYDDTDELERFWGIGLGDDGPGEANTPTEFALTIDIRAADASPGDPLIEITLPRCIHNAPNLEPDGRGRMDQAISVTALQSSIDDNDTEIKVSVGTVGS